MRKTPTSRNTRHARPVVDALTRALTAHFTASAAHLDRALDGKALRGQLQYRDADTPVAIVTAVCHATGMALARESTAAGGGARRQRKPTRS